ncbi:MAG: PD40 domain-containing protein [Acidobacteria bacterium]|nr:PD40 domain-containing protein [Acidobacteriota bacterium]
MRPLAYICLILCAALCLAGAGTARAQSAARGRIAYTSPAAGGLDLFVYDLDTGARTNVTQGRLAGVSTASWSPDGTRFVVSADRGSNLYVVNSDGAGLRALTQNTGFAITQTPTWSPDGSQIAFVCDAVANYDICLVNADGSNRRRLTNTASVYRDLAWSPDGKSIAYAGGADFFNTKIFVMNADGTLPRQLSTGDGTDLAPAWSPDGRAIAYEKTLQASPTQIFAMNADGSRQLGLTNDFYLNHHPSWSPDGKAIAYSSDRGGSGSSAIYLMNPDGSGQTRATNGTAFETAPAWRPDPTLALPDPTPTPTPVYSISGRVTDSNGAPVSGVTIFFDLNRQGALETRIAQTDAAGNYTSGELGCRNSVKVTPGKVGLSFTPEARSFVSTSCLGGAATADFVAGSNSAPRYSISGRVMDNRGTVIPDATVTLTGTVSGTTTTDAAGRYSFAGLPAGGSYALSPSKPGQFIRFASTVGALSADQTLDLRLLPYVSVFARVTDAAGNALAGVAVRPEGAFGGPLTNSNGTVNFSLTYPYGGEANIKLVVSKYGYVLDPAQVSFSTAAGNQTLSFTAALASPIYDTQFFVRQHYADFLSREPDASGLDFWAQGIDTCGGNDGCREVKRIDASAAFFLSIEFQRTGFLAYRAHRAAYGDLPGKPVPLTFAEFLADTRQLGEGVVVGPTDWQARLTANQTAYFQSFVSTERFLAKYPAGLNEDTYTNALYTTAGVSVTDEDLEASRQAFRSMGATAARAFVLQRLAEKESLQRRETNRAFVLMQYFGYLRRNPDDVGFDGKPDPNFVGYNFWLSKLEEFGGDYRRAEMVKAFLDSVEYRGRFKQP